MFLFVGELLAQKQRGEVVGQPVELGLPFQPVLVDKADDVEL